MKRLSLSLLLSVLALSCILGVAGAQSKPEFRLGFKALADQIPTVVGQPIEEEHWGANGDSLQTTTTGLMAWRKADNWTAFTDGSKTWLNGPNGVESRSNNGLLSWESPQPTIQPTATSQSQATATPQPATAPQPIVPPTTALLQAGSPGWQPGSGAKLDAPIVVFVDSPKDGDRVSGSFSVVGWAIDPNDDKDEWNGIDDFKVFSDAPGEEGGVTMSFNWEHRRRTDVASAIGNPNYANSGFGVGSNLGSQPGPRIFYFYVHSRLSGWWFKPITLVVDIRGNPTATPIPTPPPAPTGYRYIDPNAIASNPSAYIGQKVVLDGEVAKHEYRNGLSYIEFLPRGFNFGNPFRPWWFGVWFFPKQLGIEKFDSIRVYGTITGQESEKTYDTLGSLWVWFSVGMTGDRWER